MPHPEVHMNTVADIPNQRAWRVQVSSPFCTIFTADLTALFKQLVDSLEGMTKNFANPYIIFYPVGGYLSEWILISFVHIYSLQYHEPGLHFPLIVLSGRFKADLILMIMLGEVI